MTEYDVAGKKAKSAFPIIVSVKYDDLSTLINQHHRRYEYLITKLFYLLIKNDAAFLPDYSKRFCDKLQAASFTAHVQALTKTGNKINSKTIPHFSAEEMMDVASKFFYCDAGQNKKSIDTYICVGNNGLKDIKSLKDNTVLEAYAYEAIFYWITKRKKTVFEKDFNDHVSLLVAKTKTSQFSHFEEYLNFLRNDCYDFMKKNTDLKMSLLTYYNKNKDSFNFVIDL